ncbi:uncharacterized protein LOC134695097 [Mytilus trossulus]|uniref:uncharacterized protein LOC134695097 n=1 Tax=Mytilus trossulus TaxID=6551 RepID=UPI00300526D7
MNAFKNEPNCFDTENTTVCLMGKGCLIVWAESPISDLDSKDKVTEHCIQFTRNMFKKCSLYSIETANVNVTVKYSELHEESGNDEDDHLECGKCGRVCLSINSFISHKKECVRNLKRRNKQDGLKGDISSVLNSKQSRTGRISKDEENFLRIAVLIIRVASAAVRNTFIKTFHGNALTKTLFEDPTVWVSTAQDKIMSQYDLQQIILHGRSGVASVYSFSLKLMIWLIRYRTARDEDRALQDDPKHISVRDGLSRILKYKNEITRMKYPKLQEEKLEQYWTNISQAIVRLGGEGFQQKCNDLKVSILNENYIEMLTEIIEIVKSDDSNTQGFKRLLDNLFSPRTSPDPNYIRIADLLLRVGPPAVRILFDREFHPKFLQRELRKKTARLAHLKGKGMINAAQWDKLFKSKDENKSKTFDLSLMICLIRNFTNIQVTDQLPGPDDDSEGAALSRLEYYRKHIAYSQECDLSFTVFGRYWADITNAIFKIGGNKFLQRCNVLKMGKLIQKDKAILPEPTSRDIPN